MPWTFELRGPLPTATELPDFSAAAAPYTQEILSRLAVRLGRSEVPLGELFRISGSPAESVAAEHYEFAGDLTKVRGLGRGWGGGTLVVHGNVGPGAGEGLRGGLLRITGNAGDGLGAEQHGGIIRVDGNAGDLVGAALPGSVRGMTGGLLVVGGNVGAEAALRQRRGTILVGGSAGHSTACGMIAGTLLIGGSAGPETANGMRRGTVVLLSQAEPDLSPLAFRRATAFRPQFLAFWLKQLAGLLPEWSDRLAGWSPQVRPYLRRQGDLLHGGLGEIFTPA